MGTVGSAERLFVLLFAGFVPYTDYYVLAAVLPGTGVDLLYTSQLVTLFSLTVVLVAPIAAVVFVRMPAEDWSLACRYLSQSCCGGAIGGLILIKTELGYFSLLAVVCALFSISYCHRPAYS